jgi:hypothetical protein
VETKSDSDDEKMLSLNDSSEDEVKYLVQGESLVVRSALSVQVKKDDLERKRENIFYTRYHISNKICNMIIDGESYANIALLLWKS